MPVSVWREINNFNPRSREGSDENGIETKRVTKISIHAPARGATDFDKGYLLGMGISIHAPARGATSL